jgi:uncharacterized oligopeptide transporter (OPT) family protein
MVQFVFAVAVIIFLVTAIAIIVQFGMLISVHIQKELEEMKAELDADRHSRAERQAMYRRYDDATGD